MLVSKVLDKKSENITCKYSITYFTLTEHLNKARDI